ncbi:Ubiquitin-related modifier 1 [Cyphellophora attinorum]|uniref:Ubiquitin-related modifier 1 n=1 Tax=Cyphellophora attinorum TaxID=1664694 RepID=A0A0N1H7M9_9EURO|nr:Ubiquitin-related modifier 1 [Phialophora attinorum]KPI42577.1 Ubiquitin-related modifier 1 [Phialophora attinorum]
MATTAVNAGSSAPPLNASIATSAPSAATDHNAQSHLKLTVEFTGGLEILFNNVSRHRITLPATMPSSSATTQTSPSVKPTTVGYLIKWLLENLLRDPRKELFVVDGTVRPGILVLINDADWELEGEDKYELKDGDNILFVSTLHGG